MTAPVTGDASSPGSATISNDWQHIIQVPAFQEAFALQQQTVRRFYALARDLSGAECPLGEMPLAPGAKCCIIDVNRPTSLLGRVSARVRWGENPGPQVRQVTRRTGFVKDVRRWLNG